MTSPLPRLLAIVVALECCVCGWLLGHRLARPVPAVPTAFPDDPPAAAELTALAAAAASGGAEAWLMLGERLLGLGLYGHAEATLARAVDLDPAGVEPRFAWAFALDRSGRLRAAIDEYRRCLDLDEDARVGDSKKPFAALGIGNALVRLGDIADAEAAFRRLPGFPPAEFQLATLLFHDGRLEESLMIVDRNLVGLPLALEWHHLRMRILTALGRMDEAFEADVMEERGGPLMRISFSKDYLDPFAGSRLTEALEACDRLDPVRDGVALTARLDAIDALIGSRPLPERLLVEVRRARLALAAKEPDRADAILDRIEAAGRVSGDTFMLRAAAAELRGDTAGAAAWGSRAAAVSPAAEIRFQLAAEAERLGDRAARDRYRGQGLFLEAITLYGRNRPGEALVKLRESAAVAAEAAATWFRIGECEYVAGNREAAATAYRRAVDLRPGYGRASDRLERRIP